MSQKRQQEEDAKPTTDEGCSSDDKRRKTPLRNAVEVMKFQNLQQFFEPVLEPLIRKVVKEEVDLALRKHFTSVEWNSGEEMQPSDPRSLQLQFIDTISLPVFTGSRIEGEECTTMKVALVDAVGGKVVSNGPISSAKVEVVVLEGDFDGNDGDNWTLEEFKSNLVRARKGKKALLTGDAFLNLKEGIGLLGEISFTDNSSWTRCRKFRLGARIVNNCDGIRVREAKTESFIVRDHRGELYKKHYPPCLLDEVWRLEKIGKEGAFHKRLSMEKVNTVKDFLILLFLDPARLRYILGTGMSAKMWEVTMEHARSCVLDKRLYLYRPRSQEKTGVVFNVVGQVMGLLSDHQYVPTDKLSKTEKADAHSLVILAFKQWEEVVALDDDTSLVDGFSLLSNVLYPSNSPMAGSSDNINILTSVKDVSFDYPQLSASTPDVYSLGCASSMDDCGMRSIESIDVRFDQTSSFPNQAANSLICDTESNAQALFEDEHLQYFDTDCSLQSSCPESQADQLSGVDGFLYAHSEVAIVKAHRRWTILFSVLRWFSIRRIVARKSTLEKHVYS